MGERVGPLGEEVAAELRVAVLEGHFALGTTPSTSAADILRAVEGVIRRRRRLGRALGGDASIDLGAVVGSVYVRELGWEWVEYFGGDYLGVAVTNAERTMAILPINTVSALAADTGRELTLAATYDLVRTGESLPCRGAGSPTLLS